MENDIKIEPVERIDETESVNKIIVEPVEKTNQISQVNNMNSSIDKVEKVNIEKPIIRKKKNKKVGRTIVNIITIILFIVVLIEATVGIVNMQRINNNEEPIWYLTTKTTETELKTVTEYNLGFYKIVKTDTAKETKTTLKPFFLSE